MDNIYSNLDGEELIKLKHIYLISATYSAISFPCMPFNGILMSFEKFSFLKITDLLNKVMIVLLMVISLLMGKGLYALVTVNSIVGVFVLALKFIYIYKHKFVQPVFRHNSMKTAKEIAYFSIWSSIASLASRLIYNLVPSIIACFCGSVEIAYFSICNVLEGYIYTFANALNGFFLPKITKLVSTNNENKVLDLMIVVGRIQLVIVGVIIIGFINVGYDFICLWMGESFKVSYYGTVLIILPSLISLTQEIGNTLITVKNEIKILAVLNVTATLLNIILLFIFVPILKTFGACIAIFITVFFRDVIAKNIIFYKNLELDVISFFKECHLKFLLPITITLIIGFLTNYIISAITWGNLIIKAIITLLSYICLVYIFTINRKEKNVLKILIANFITRR